MRSGIACLWVVALVAVGCQDTTLSRTKPEIVVEPEVLSFGEVSLLSIENQPLTVKNEGTGYLEIMNIEVLDDEGAFWVSGDPYTLVGDEDWSVNVSFAPVLEELQQSQLRITSNDPEQPLVDVALEGSGVRPVLDILPSALHFDTSEGAEAESQTVVMDSTGSGPVVITGIEIGVDEEGAFSVAVPASVSMPYLLEPGLSIEVSVDHVPVIGASYGAELHVYSNDLNDEDQAVTLTASGTGAAGEPPVVEITSPASGSAVEDGMTVDFDGLVSDPDQPPETLVTYFQSNLQGNLGTVFPDGDGNVSLDGVELEIGTHTVTLVAIDDQANTAQDAVIVMVWEPGQTFDYVISGGDTPFHYFFVDDDIIFYLDEVPFFVDSDGSQDLHAPVAVTAEVGAILRIEATDYVACTKAIDALSLHLNEANIQLLSDAVSVSACDDHEDYDAAYAGPWPNTFLNEQYVIAIP